MKVTECYGCGSKDHEQFYKENGYSLVKCAHCGLLFVNNPPEEREISEANRQGIHRGTKSLHVTGHYSSEKIPHYLEILNDFYTPETVQQKKWLDIGCGYGEFMEAIRIFSPALISVKGSEPNVAKQRSARRRGLEVEFYEIGTHVEKYDFISLLNVYSHLPNPPNFLKALKSNLNARGEILIETSDSAGINASAQVKPFYLPDHLSFVSEKILVSLLIKAGFEIIDIKKYPFQHISAIALLKNTVKLFIPHAHSKLRYMFSPGYDQYDMWVRARVRQ